MKNNDVRTLVLLVSSLLFATFVRADEIPYEQILTERDAVLSRILAEHEFRGRSGFGDPEKAFAARIALWSFRRDTAVTKEEKIKQQELMVQEHDKNHATVKERMSAGLADAFSVLLATDKLLEAKQVLAELRMKK